MAPNIFSVPIFFIMFRETIECALIVSILLAFLKQTVAGPGHDPVIYKRLQRQVWLGTATGFLVCLVVSGALIGVFYTTAVDWWADYEYTYEGAFCLIASVIITIVGAAMLRIGKVQDKWRVKLTKAMAARKDEAANETTGGNIRQFGERYAMFLLPLVTVLREGVETIVFIAGVSFSVPATAVPLPAIVGALAGSFVGYLLYKSGSTARLQLFLVVSTCILYLVAAALFSRAVWFFEAQQWNNLIGADAAELGDGAGSYDIDKSVWHVNCCSPTLNGGGGWGVFNSVLGWQNSATYGSVISYNVYWIVVIAAFLSMRYREVKGHWPLLRPKDQHQLRLLNSRGSANSVSTLGGGDGADRRAGEAAAR